MRFTQADFETLKELTQKMRADMERRQIVSPLCADDLHEGCTGFLLGTNCSCECHSLGALEQG